MNYNEIGTHPESKIYCFAVDLSTVNESRLLDLFLVCTTLHYNMLVEQILDEAMRRELHGQLTILDHSPTLNACNMPKLFYFWPFRLLWRQKRRGRVGKNEMV